MLDAHEKFGKKVPEGKHEWRKRWLSKCNMEVTDTCMCHEMTDVNKWAIAVKFGNYLCVLTFICRYHAFGEGKCLYPQFADNSFNFTKLMKISKLTPKRRGFGKRSKPEL
uniref:Uncharacterized protein n=1 Tax=Onchocerca volvulus TaxID=6282 RepID=A0A8R1Y4T6_ONCVO